MPSPFAITLEPFKQEVAKFIKHCANPDVPLVAVSEAHKLIGLYYLNFQSEDKPDLTLATSYFDFAQRRYLERELCGIVTVREARENPTWASQ